MQLNGKQKELVLYNQGLKTIFLDRDGVINEPPDDAEKYKAYKKKLDDVMTCGQVGYELRMCGEEE